MDLLPPRISDPGLFALFADILAVPTGSAERTSALRLRFINQHVSWQALAQMADEQGALLPLIGAIIRQSLLLPVPSGLTSEARAQHPTVQLITVYKEHLARHLRQREQLVDILKTLNRQRIAPMLLKGARYLFAPPGDWCEARDMRDIDLMIDPLDSERAVTTLAAEGYVADKRPVPIDQHLPEMWHDRYPSAVELHTEALSFSARKMLPTEELWRRGVRMSTAEGDFFVLPIEWHLLHGTLNHQIADRCYAQHLLTVKPLWEFAMLAGYVSDQGWKSIADHMSARGCADVLASSIVQAARLFGMVMPSKISISPAARTHAEATFENAAAPDWLRRVRFLADQLRYGFARETLAARYRLTEDNVSIWTRARHLRFLIQYYRGRIGDRLFGQRGRMS
jgi:Uncharacterised nucleotidyltransferase